MGLQDYLESEIERKWDTFSKNVEFLDSLTYGFGGGERVTPLDVRTCLRVYRDLIEIHSLLEVYNSKFESASMTGLSEKISAVLNPVEENMITLLQIPIKS